MKRPMKAWAVVDADDVGGSLTQGYVKTKCGGAMHLQHLNIFIHRHDAEDACRETKGQRVIPVKISHAK